MIKRTALFLLFAMMIALFTVCAVAQNFTAIKGNCKDETGKPLAGANVELANQESGHKYIAKTDSKGDYFYMGARPGIIRSASSALTEN